MRIFRVPGQQRALMETQFAPWGPEAQMIQGSTSGVLGSWPKKYGQMVAQKSLSCKASNRNCVVETGKTG